MSLEFVRNLFLLCASKCFLQSNTEGSECHRRNKNSKSVAQRWRTDMARAKHLLERSENYR